MRDAQTEKRHVGLDVAIFIAIVNSPCFSGTGKRQVHEGVVGDSSADFYVDIGRTSCFVIGGALLVLDNEVDGLVAHSKRDAQKESVVCLGFGFGKSKRCSQYYKKKQLFHDIPLKNVWKKIEICSLVFIRPRLVALIPIFTPEKTRNHYAISSR